MVLLASRQWIQTQKERGPGCRKLCVRQNSRYGPSHQVQVNGLPQHAPSSAEPKNRPMNLSKSLLLVIDETLAHTEVWYWRDQGQPHNPRIYADNNS